MCLTLFVEQEVVDGHVYLEFRCFLAFVVQIAHLMFHGSHFTHCGFLHKNATEVEFPGFYLILLDETPETFAGIRQTCLPGYIFQIMNHHLQ